MATTLATAAAEVIERLKIPAGEGAAPDSTMIEGFLRGGFKVLWGLYQPIFRAGFSVSETYGVTTVSADLSEILYVSGARDMMVPMADYVETLAGINLRDSTLAVEADAVVVWYTSAPDDFDTALSIDSSCIFGQDWLEEAVLMYAEMMAKKRMSNVNDSGGSNAEAATWVTIQRDYQALTEGMRTTRAMFTDRMDRRLALRLQARDIRKEAGLQSFNNESGVKNRATLVSPGIVDRRAP